MVRRPLRPNGEAKSRLFPLAPAVGPELLKVAPDNVNEFLGTKCAVAISVGCGISNVQADVVLKDLRHQPIERSPGGGNELEDIGAGPLSRECALDCLKLARDAPDALKQLSLLIDCVSHEVHYTIPQYSSWDGFCSANGRRPLP